MLAIKEQSRHTNIKTTYDFYIGTDSDYQREQNEKLTLKVGKKGGIMIHPQPTPLVMLNYLLISKNYGEPCGDRTHDHLIKSQVLYRLS